MFLRELTKALHEGKEVRWSNEDYTVYWDGPIICVHYERTGMNCALAIEEIKDCYVKG